MFRRLLPTSLALVAVFAASCQSMSVEVFTDPAFQPGTAPTWAWRDPVETATPQVEERDRETSELIRAEVESGLEALGYERSADGVAPELFVHAEATVQEHVDRDYAVNRYGDNYGEGGFGTTVQPVTLVEEEGSLLLQVLRASDNHVLWSGTARAVVDRHHSAEKRTRRVTEAVARLMAELPAPRP